MTISLGKYSKFWLAFIAVVVSWVSLVSKPPAHVSSHEIVIGVSGVVTAVVTWLIPMSKWRYGKVVGNVLTAAVSWIVIVVDSAAPSITATEWALALSMLLTAAGVYAVSNAPSSTVARTEEP